MVKFARFCRHQSSDERESTMEMTKLLTNPDPKEISESGMKTSAHTEVLNTSLHQLSKNGDEQVIKAFLRCMGPQLRNLINKLDERQFTPLHYAARYNCLNVVKLLVEAGADVQAVGKEDITPLHNAAYYRLSEKKMRQLSTEASDEDVSVPLPPPPEVEFSEEDTENERMIEAYQAWEDRASVSLDHVEDHEILGQIGAGDLPAVINHCEREKGGSVVSYLISQGANINALDIYLQTPLHFAVKRGNGAACRDLLSHKSRIKIEASDKQGTTPLHTASIHSRMEIARMLIEAGANLMCRNKELSTALHIACMSHSSDLVQLLLDAGAKLRDSCLISEMINAVDIHSYTPLHISVEHGNHEATKLLLEKQSDVNKPCIYNNYPLHLAAQYDDIQICQLLLDNHASIDALNDNLYTALHRASALNNLEVAKFLIERGADINKRNNSCYTPLLLAVDVGNVQMVEMLLQKGADYTAVENHDKTAIFLAAEFNHVNVLNKLLAYPQIKKFINDSDSEDNDPLHIAARYGHLGIVQTLLNNGASLDSKNEDEQTPLHLASKYGKTNIVQELINCNKNIMNDEDENSNTALHLAAQNGNSKVVDVLLNLGAFVHARNYNQWTPLHLAASKGWLRTCQVLLEGNASVDVPGSNNITSLHLAAHNGHALVVELLLNEGADVTIHDDQGKNSLDRAIDANNTTVAMVIVNSSTWKDALRNAIKDPATGRIVTPMRKLIRKMPEVAQRVFDRCMSFKNEQNPERADYEITFDYEFLDDVYASWIHDSLKHDGGDERSDVALSSGNLFGNHDEDTLPLSAVPYSRDSDVLKKNHPLFIMILSERENLLAHPLVTSLLQHKWNTFGRFFYYLSFFIYVIFLIFLSAYMIITDPPHLYGADGALIEDNQCGNLTKQYEQPLAASIGTYVIIALAAFNMLKELFQIYQAKLNYFGWTNIIEWTVYVTSLLLVISFNECQRITGYRFEINWPTTSLLNKVWIDTARRTQTSNFPHIPSVLMKVEKGPPGVCAMLGLNCVSLTTTGIMLIPYLVSQAAMKTTCLQGGLREVKVWQWNLGAVSVFLVWFDLVLYIQKVPRFGIYVVMFTDILRTFSQFFVVFFLFIVAYAMAFYVVFQNKLAFSSIPRSLLKTYVMMIGELEFDFVFNDPASERVYYPEISYILFVIFLTSMSILIMNLLVGLAVDDIKGVQQQAALKRMAMQVELALDVERIIPDFIRQKAFSQKKTIFPNKTTHNPFWRIFSDSYLTREALQMALHPKLDDIGTLKVSHNKLSAKLKFVKRTIKAIKVQNSRLESMLHAVIEAQNINWQEEDYQEEDSKVKNEEEEEVGML